MAIFGNAREAGLEHPVQLTMTDNAFFFSTTKSLARLDGRGHEVWKATTAGDRPLDGLTDFDFTRDGKILVANPFQKTVEVFGPGGDWIRNFGGNELSDAFTLRALPGDDVLVADAKKHRLCLFDSEGNLKATTGARGVAAGQFRFPNGIVVLPGGDILISESNNVRIQRLSRDLEFKAAWLFPKSAVLDGGKSGDLLEITSDGEEAELHTYAPLRLAADLNRGRIYVGVFDDFGSPRGHIAAFNLNGKFIEKKKLKTTGGKRFEPQNIQPMPDGHMAVTDIEHFQVGYWNPETAVVRLSKLPAVTGALASMSNTYKSNRKIIVAGRSGVGIGVILVLLVIGIMSYQYSARQSAGRNESAGLLGALMNVFSRSFGGNSAVSTPPSTVEKVSRITLIVSFILFITNPFSIIFLKKIIAFKILRLLIMMTWTMIGYTGFLISLFIYLSARRKRGAMEPAFVQTRDKIFLQIREPIQAALRKEEYIVDVAFTRIQMGGAVLLVLTNQRLIETNPGGSSIFQKKTAFQFHELSEYAGMQVQEQWYLPTASVMTLSLKTGRKKKYYSMLYMGSYSFLRAFYAVLQSQPPAAPIGAAYATCRFCGRTLAPGTKLCTHCHTRPNNPVIAAVLSILLPGLGHIYNKKYLFGGLHVIWAAFSLGLFYGHFANVYVLRATVALYVLIIQYVIIAVVSAVQAYREAAFVSD